MTKYCLYFDGKDDYVEVGYSDSLALHEFTVEVLAKALTSKLANGILGTRFGDEYTFDLKFRYTEGFHGDVGDGTKWLSTKVDWIGGIELNRYYLVHYLVQTNKRHIRGCRI